VPSTSTTTFTDAAATSIDNERHGLYDMERWRIIDGQRREVGKSGGKQIRADDALSKRRSCEFSSHTQMG
jgi:hypothetical protein